MSPRVQIPTYRDILEELLYGEELIVRSFLLICMRQQGYSSQLESLGDLSEGVSLGPQRLAHREGLLRRDRLSLCKRQQDRSLPQRYLDPLDLGS